MSRYIDNNKFEEVIKGYKVSPKIYEDALVEMFDLLINNIFDSFGFTIEKEDAKQDCFVLILKTIKNFNPENGSAFNYFTTIIVNNLKLLYSKNKKYQEKLAEYSKKLEKLDS